MKGQITQSNLATARGSSLIVPPLDPLILPIEDSVDPEHDSITRAADLINLGKLVAFPTETVYGLGADATCDKAVRKIFQAKGRPGNNPLIVHFPSADAIAPYVTEWPREAELLAHHFWPGPLTIILPVKSGKIAPSVLAGGKTIGVRVPAHPVAIALLTACQCPVAAPSANQSTSISPTNAQIVLHSLAGKIDAIVDGGSCPVGIESTVLDLSQKTPCVLRPGMISAEEIEKVLGKQVPVQPQHRTEDSSGALISPGQLKRHYAPQIPLHLKKTLPKPRPATAFLIRLGNVFSHTEREITLPSNPTQVAERLYWALHLAETSGAQEILMELPPESVEWIAIHDRLSRACED